MYILTGVIHIIPIPFTDRNLSHSPDRDLSNPMYDTVASPAAPNVTSSPRYIYIHTHFVLYREVVLSLGVSIIENGHLSVSFMERVYNNYCVLLLGVLTTRDSTVYNYYI